MRESPQRGNPGDPGGNEMESEEMEDGPPKGQDRECGKAWERVLVVANGCQETKKPAKNVVLARDTRTSEAYMYNVRWTSKLRLLCLIAAVNKSIYQQQKDSKSCKIKFLKA
jgi:hypothetical protein